MGAFRWQQEQPADLAGTIQIGGQGQHFGAEGAAQLAAMLGQRAEAVGIKRPLRADLAEDLAGAADLPGLGIFQHEQEQIIGDAVLVPRETGRGALQPGRQRGAIRRQIGQPAAGGQRHGIDGLQIIEAGGA